MKVIWVLENVQDDEKVFGKLNTLLLIASVKLWKKNHPETNCVLYCDALTHTYITRLGIGHLWDKVEQFQRKRELKRSVFWAASKLEVLSEQNEPVILMDNDTLIYKPLLHLLERDKHYVCNFEIGQGYYPTSLDPLVSQLSYKPRWKMESVNVSFLYLPDPEFTKMYANLSLDIMEEFTKMDAPHSQYLIFAEQLLLSHLLERENKEVRSIISTYWNCQKWEWDKDHTKGLWPIHESQTHFKHDGPLKVWIIQDQGGESYEREMKELENCVKMPNLDMSFLTVR